MSPSSVRLFPTAISGRRSPSRSPIHAADVPKRWFVIGPVHREPLRVVVAHEGLSQHQAAAVRDAEPVLLDREPGGRHDAVAVVHEPPGEADPDQDVVELREASVDDAVVELRERTAAHHDPAGRGVEEAHLEAARDPLTERDVDERQRAPVLDPGAADERDALDVDIYTRLDSDERRRPRHRRAHDRVESHSEPVQVARYDERRSERTEDRHAARDLDPVPARERVRFLDGGVERARVPHRHGRADPVPREEIRCGYGRIDHQGRRAGDLRGRDQQRQGQRGAPAPRGHSGRSPGHPRDRRHGSIDLLAPVASSPARGSMAPAARDYSRAAA